ncbi:MAG: hypothetical protein V1702_02035 [Candidatus Woesearchaeota archaeon]
MHRLLLKSLAKAHKKIEAKHEIILTRIARLEATAGMLARNHPEAVEIIDKLWIIRKRIQK